MFLKQIFAREASEGWNLYCLYCSPLNFPVVACLKTENDKNLIYFPSAMEGICVSYQFPLYPLQMILHLYMFKQFYMSTVDLTVDDEFFLSYLKETVGESCLWWATSAERALSSDSRPRAFYLTIIRRRRSEYCRIIPSTSSRGLFDNIHFAFGE